MSRSVLTEGGMLIRLVEFNDDFVIVEQQKRSTAENEPKNILVFNRNDCSLSRLIKLDRGVKISDWILSGFEMHAVDYFYNRIHTYKMTSKDNGNHDDQSMSVKGRNFNFFNFYSLYFTSINKFISNKFTCDSLIKFYQC